MTKYCTSCCETNAVICEMLLDVVGAQKASKVAMEVVGLSLVEVLVADGVDVFNVLSLGYIDLALFDEIL
jgi:hypothetical protein